MRKTVGLLAGLGVGILFAQTCQLRPRDPHESLTTTFGTPPSAPAQSPIAAGSSAPADPPAESSDALFARTVKPVLASRCAPCHNPGGSMYARLPFDDPKTVADHQSGIAKRIKKDDERAAMEAWLAARRER